MKLKHTSVLLILFLTGFVYSQSRIGNMEIVNYPPEITNGTEINWAIARDNRGVLYVGNDENGILEYDGNEWRTIPVSNNSTIRSLACDEDGTIYVGAVNEIGYLAPDKFGQMEYISLTPLVDTALANFTDIWKTYTFGDLIYFCARTCIHEFNKKTRTLKSHPTFDHTLFSFHEKGHLYLGVFTDGLTVLDADSITHAIGGDYYRSKDIYSLTSYDDDHLIIACGGHGLSLYNIETGEIDSVFAPKETNAYLNESIAYHLINMPDGNFFVSTIYGGAVIINPEGEILEILTKEDGLQDESIYYSYLDANGHPYLSMWSALSIGISKIDIGSPFRILTEEAGLQGLINSIIYFEGKLYVGTMSGLYQLGIKKGKSLFEKNTEINTPVWAITNFKLNRNSECLLAITQNGFYQIMKDGQTIKLDNSILDRRDKEDLSAWGYSIYNDPIKTNRVYLGMESSIQFLNYDNGKWREERDLSGVTDEIRSMTIDKEGYLWFGMKLTGVAKVNSNDTTDQPHYYKIEDGLPSLNQNGVYSLDDELLIGTENGIYRYDFENDSIVKYDELNQYLPKGKNSIYRIYKDQGACIWLSFDNSILGWLNAYLKPVGEKKYELVHKPFLTMSDFSTDAFYSTSEKDMWFSKSDKLYHFDKSVEYIKGSYQTLVRRVASGVDSVIFYGTHIKSINDSTFIIGGEQSEEQIAHIKHSDNNIEFRWSCPYFDHEGMLVFSYYLEGFSDEWSEWEKVHYQDFTNLPHGTYNFRIRAKNIYGEISEEDNYAFIILRPWYLSFFAFLGYIIIAIVVIYVIIALYTRRLKNENIRLEGIIEERTTEIRKQKEELTDSIEYASRIQRALLPPDQLLASHNIDHFILFRPRDIVSGDFYWFGISEEKIFIVAADCTGHGVPGAFMSMLGISFLDEIVIKSGVCQTNEILDALKDHVITSLRQTGKGMEESTKDGMDMSMIAIDKKTKGIQFSGAYNPLYVVRKLKKEESDTLKKGGELELERGSVHNDTHLLYQIKGDPMPIGISEKEFFFSSADIQEENATYYLFSDGYVDQFGGPSGKKFMSKNFKKLLLEIQGRPMPKQQELLNNKLIEWMGNISQIDDVLVIGIKIGG